MKTNLDDIRTNILLFNYDIIIGTEAWLDDSVNDGEILDSRYHLYRRDRISTTLGAKKGPGVLVAVSKNINSVRMTKWETETENL